MTDTLWQAAQIIAERILTPFVYACTDGPTVFIIMMGDGVTEDDVEAVEMRIKIVLGLDCEIVDLREFDRAERREVLECSEKLFEINGLTGEFVQQMLDMENMNIEAEKQEMVERRTTSGTYYAS